MMGVARVLGTALLCAIQDESEILVFPTKGTLCVSASTIN